MGTNCICLRKLPNKQQHQGGVQEVWVVPHSSQLSPTAVPGTLGVAEGWRAEGASEPQGGDITAGSMVPHPHLISRWPPAPPPRSGQRQACAGPLALLAVLKQGQASLIELHPRQGWVRVFSAPPASGTPSLALGRGRERGPCCQAAAVARPPSQCLARGTRLGATKGTHSALSALHPRQPHVNSLHPQVQPRSCAHTACTHVQSHTHTHDPSTVG